MGKYDKRDLFLLLLCTLALVALRLYLLPRIGFSDYDATYNWTVARELADGNWKNLFHHRSPLFFLFYSLFVPLFPDFHLFLYLNLLLQVAAVLLLFDFVRQHLPMPKPEQYLFLLLLGSSVFLVHSSRQFTIESPSLLLFVLFFRTYYRRLQQHDRRALLRSGWLLALSLPLNYKFLLMLPVAAVLEWRFHDGVLNRNTFLQLALILLSPFLLFSLVAVVVGLPFYAYAGTYIGFTHFTGVQNAAGRQGSIFGFDVDYYFRFLLEYESWLLLPALVLFPLLYRRELFGRFRTANLYQYLFVFAYAFLLGMSVLLKAPRGLLFVYGLFYVLAFLVLQRLFRRPQVVQALLALAFLLNLYKLDRHIYDWSRSGYAEVAQYLQEQGVKKLTSTVGLNLLPYIYDKGIEMVVIEDEAALDTLQQQGVDYVLLDDYYKVTNIRNFEQLEKRKPVLALPEPALLSPLLYLEHSEFTGLSYSETKALHRQALQDSVQLRLLRLD